MNYKKPTAKISILPLIFFLQISCVHVDVCRWAVTPTIDTTIRSHAGMYKFAPINMENQPPGSSLKKTRISSQHNQVDLSVTELNIPDQTTALVYCGGNAFRQGQYAPALFNAFAPAISIMLFDYPGYGQSTGEATAQEFAIATELLGGHIAKWQQENNFKKIVFWGHSFGGTICARLAGNYPLNSTLVLESTYNSLQSLATSKAGIFKNIITVNFDADAPDFHIDQSLKNYPHPIALLKSSNDPITPPEESEQLAKLLLKQGKTVSLVNMGAIHHREVLFYPCLAAYTLAKITPTKGDITANPSLCKTK